MRVDRLLASLATAVMVVGLGVSAAPAAFAGTDEFQVEISNTDAQFARWSGDCSGTGGGPYYYRTFTLNVSESGDYIYYDIGYNDFDGDPPYVDMEIGIYNLGAFDPSAPGGGCVFTRDDNGTATLGAGQYTLVVTTHNTGETGTAWWRLTGPGSTSIGARSGGPTKDLTVWYQSIGRSGTDAVCPEGYNPSWAQWSNGGGGGWVCNKEIYAYYPNEPVR